jgi:2-methylisocitrate lyase-like PEP mutase family enzyme
MPNAWDVGSARILASLGFKAIATTSSGHAASLGRMDQRVTLEELLTHVSKLVDAVDIPVSVDAERCFADDAAGVAATAERITGTGAVGLAVERVAAAAEVTKTNGMVLTARAENHLYGIEDLDDTITRLTAYRQAGADVVYAPWLADIAQIEAVVTATRAPVNVLARDDGLGVAELAAAGVRRVSTGGALAFAAYGALAAAARELLSEGTSTYIGRGLSMDDRRAAFDG